ncbi:MAG: membrane protein insertase YidC [Akkermansiaceae bacterium]
MDRKAWIVVSLCAILLALNLHYTGEAAKERREAELAEQKQKEKEGQETDQVPEKEIPSVTVKPRPVAEDTGTEESHEIATATSIFTLSNLEGGIVQNKLLEEKAVYGDGLITMNDLGLNRIGAITKISGESLEKGYYDPDESRRSETSITYKGSLANNLTAYKTWTAVDENSAGSQYRLQFKLRLENTTNGEISLNDVAIFNGSAAPTYEGERSNYLNFFWNENSDYDSETTGYFSSFFGADATEFRETFQENLLYTGVENQFFATILTPEKPYPGTFRAILENVELPDSRGNKTAQAFNTYLTLPNEAIPAGQSREYVFDVFMGPKNNALIRSLDGDKGHVMDYGFFALISRPLNWTLNQLSNLFGGENNDWSWGWAIVVLTLIIRTFMWPLHAKSTRTMKRMSKLQPKIAALKEKYPDDPNKMNQEMMKLYRQFGVNPMGGCLPMIVQIPIFFGFYSMLQYAVELRNQPFLGWVDDLSQPDTITYIMGLPLNILPILMAVTMVIQMQLTPKTGDKMQQRIFMLMPLIFFFFCYNFASALALYWTTQNIFSIGQTWLMQKLPEPELKTSKKAGKKGWGQRLAEKAEAAQKNQAQKGGAKRPGQKQAKPKKPRGPKTGG